MENKKTKDVAILIGEIEHGGYHSDYVHMKAWPVLLNEAGQGSVTYPGDYFDVNGLFLQSLTIHSQGNNNDAERRLYCHDVRYQDVYCVDRQNAPRMAKTFVLLDKRLAKLNDVRGYARTYGEYVGRVAEAIGASQILRRNKQDRTDYVRRNLGDGVSMIDSMVREWVNERERQTTAVA